MHNGSGPSKSVTWYYNLSAAAESAGKIEMKGKGRFAMPPVPIINTGKFLFFLAIDLSLIHI